MALDLSATNMLAEITAARRLVASVVKPTDALVRAFHGQFYRNGIQPDDPVPENHAFEWLSLVTPKIIYDNPTVTVSSRRSGISRNLTKGFEHALNRWSRDVELWRTLQLIWYDMAFSFGVSRMAFSPIPGYPGYQGMKPMRPMVYRVDPGRFFADHKQTAFSSCRFKGHTLQRDKDDLLKAEGFNKKAIEDVAADAGLDMLRPPDVADGNPDLAGPSRKEIVLYEVWVPEKQLTDDPGYHGAIYTLATAVNPEADRQAEPQWVREPRPFYGPDTGPYEVWGCYDVPGQLFPLSPLAAVQDQVAELNSHATAAARAAANYKRGVAYDPANPEAGKQAKTFKHGEVFAVPGLSNGSMQQIELGGPVKDMNDFVQILRERVDRVTGLGEVQRGNASSGSSATAVMEAANAHNDRLALIQSRFKERTARVLRSAGWYIWHSEFSIFPLGEEAISDLAPRPKTLPPESKADELAQLHGLPVEEVREALRWEPDLRWYGGIEETNYDDVMLEIEAYSMVRVDNAILQKRAMDMMEFLIQAAPLIPNSPYIDWQRVFEMFGEPMNIKGLGDIINLDTLSQQAGPAQMPIDGQAAMPGQPAPADATIAAPTPIATQGAEMAAAANLA